MNEYAFDSLCGRWRGPLGRFVRTRLGRRRTDRWGRAVELTALRRVQVVGDGTADVWSIDGAHVYHVVDDDCECPDALYHRRTVCKHVIAVAMARRRLGALMRETGGTPVSARAENVDPEPTEAASLQLCGAAMADNGL